MTDHSSSRYASGYFRIDRSIWELIRSRDPSEIKVYLELACMADKDGCSYPSASTLVDRLAMARRTVFKAVNALVDSGLIRRESSKGCKASNTYWLVPSNSVPHDTINSVPQCTIKPSNSVPHDTINSVPQCTRIVSPSALNSALRDTQNKNHEQESRNKKRTASVSFVKPTVDQVKQFVEENDFQVDPEEWVDHYQANGWMVGRGNRMKDWQAVVRQWHRRRDSFQSNGRRATVTIESPRPKR